MVQKLIRLTSNSGDGVFNGIFNENIDIKEKSEIALQSLSVERQSDQIIITNENGVIQFSSTGAIKGADGNFSLLQQGQVSPQGLFNRENYTDLLKNISSAMNRDCNLNTENAEWGLQYECRVNENGKIEIRCLASPFYQIQKPATSIAEALPDFIVNDRSVEENIVAAEILNVWEEYQTGEYGMWRESDTTTGGGGGEPLLTESYMFSTLPCTKSTGIQRTRFKRLNTDGAGTHSFTMGLVKGAVGLSKLQGASFDLTDVVYAIRANGHNSPMQYLTSAGGAWVNTVTPVNYTTADWELNLNDVIDLEFAQGGVKGVISSQTGGTPTKTILNSAANFDDGEDYYFFISMHEGKTKCVLDLTGMTLDPFGVGEGASTRVDNITAGEIPNSLISGIAQFAGSNNSEGLTVAPFTPAFQLDQQLAEYLGFVGSGVLSPITVFPEKAVVYFGMGDRQFSFSQRIGFGIIGSKFFDNSYDSDTYLIDTQSFMLDSFDSFGLSSNDRNANSGGSRRNIIATVPISETPIVGSGNSIIQFQPATLNYIAIKNRGDMSLRQIRCRLLTGQYNPVETQGLASIVLLIREAE